MSEITHNCAIIGGGLAGLTLAIQLADLGRTVVLFEKEKYPFNKVCGEYISMESYAFLERIGLPLPTMDVAHINEVKISAVNGNSLTRKLDLGGFGISRYTLDSYLAQLAVKKGVTLLENTKVFDVSHDPMAYIIKANTKEYRVGMACGAFGKRSSLTRDNAAPRNKRNYVAIKYHVKTDLPANRIELHNFKGGYCGISKVDGDKYCLCYLTDSVNLTQSGNSIKEMEEKVLMKNPFLKKYFTEAEFLYKEPITISQVTFKRKEQVQNGIIMLGDAAGTIAPLCGNGMSMAMHASFIAAPLVNEYCKGNMTRGQLFQRYQRAWNNEFSKRIKIGEKLQGLFGKNTLTNMSIAFFKVFPMVANKVISMTHGEAF